MGFDVSHHPRVADRRRATCAFGDGHDRRRRGIFMASFCEEEPARKQGGCPNHAPAPGFRSLTLADSGVIPTGRRLRRVFACVCGAGRGGLAFGQSGLSGRRGLALWRGGLTLSRRRFARHPQLPAAIRAADESSRQLSGVDRPFLAARTLHVADAGRRRSCGGRRGRGPRRLFYGRRLLTTLGRRGGEDFGRESRVARGATQRLADLLRRHEQFLLTPWAAEREKHGSFEAGEDLPWQTVWPLTGSDTIWPHLKQKRRTTAWFAKEDRRSRVCHQRSSCLFYRVFGAIRPQRGRIRYPRVQRSGTLG